MAALGVLLSGMYIQVVQPPSICHRVLRQAEGFEMAIQGLGVDVGVWLGIVGGF